MGTHQPTPEPPPADGGLRPLDPPMLPLALAGTGIWAVVGLVLLAAGAPDGWLRTCLAGLLLGLPLAVLMAGHDRRRRRRR